MPQIVMDVVENSAPPRNLAGSGYRNLLAENGRYVFDGNRVIARFRIGRNGVGRWRLETINPSLYFAVGRDLRVCMHGRVEGRWAIRVIDEFESVFDSLKPLEEAICDCAQKGHAWSPAQTCSEMEYVWKWCVLCAAEEVWFPDTADWLTWPADADEIAARTGRGRLTLHGPVVGGAR